MASGFPPRDCPRAPASKTHTSARPTPAVVSWGSTGLFCPRCAVVMKARLPPGPAKTMSLGSSPTRRVRATRGDQGREVSTMLTLSERWFTTQTSSLDRQAMAIGSRPTGAEPRRVSPRRVIRKTSSRLSGVLAAKRCLPSGEIASGRTCPDSKSVKSRSASGGEAPSWSRDAPASRSTDRTAMVARRPMVFLLLHGPDGEPRRALRMQRPAGDETVKPRRRKTGIQGVRR